MLFHFHILALQILLCEAEVINGNISVFYTLSVRNNSEYTSIFNTAINNWNNISSRIKLKRVYSDQNVGSFVFAVTNNTNPNILGMMIPYYKNHQWQIIPNLRAIDQTWFRTDIYIYTNNMNRFSMNFRQKVSNATHEIWHSLKLAHPWQGTERCVDLPWWQKSVMNQWIQNIWPQQYDRNDIIYKWWR